MLLKKHFGKNRGAGCGVCVCEGGGGNWAGAGVCVCVWGGGGGMLLACNRTYHVTLRYDNKHA